MFKFSDTSQDRLNTCHKDLQTIMLVALALSDIDFGIAEGYRSVERQKQLYDDGKSQLDGINKLSNHNYAPSMAVDIYAYVNGKADYDPWNMSYLAGVILSTAKRLYESGRISHHVRWGGTWGKWKDGCNYDGFVDMVHFELI